MRGSRRRPAYPWVSRGGVKLAAALDAFAIDPAGKRALDIGASTGGFAHVLLTRGVMHVTCVDVGHGQLHPSIAADSRVKSLERRDARTPFHRRPSRPAATDRLRRELHFAGTDPAAGSGARGAEKAEAVLLIKPQFEVGPELVKKGIVRDEAAQKAACDENRGAGRNPLAGGSSA